MSTTWVAQEKMNIRGQQLRRRLTQRQPVYCLLHGLCSPAAAELAALAGYDAVIIDDEHGPSDRSLNLNIAQAVAAGGAACLMRLASHDPLKIGQALDLGVDGLLIPGIHSAEDAAAVVRASRYPPAGSRGYGLSMARAGGYGLYPKRYSEAMEQGVLLAAMIESRRGVEHAAAIAGTPGVDVVILGLQDLTADMGVPGEFEHPEVQKAIAAIESAVLAAGKALGAAVYPGVNISQLLQRGHRFITLGIDTRLLGAAMRQQLNDCSDL
ncbi:MAG: HpcH/HpaI aldolase/citrate lyase family protein [Pigmentiphaga sp.]